MGPMDRHPDLQTESTLASGQEPDQEPGYEYRGLMAATWDLFRGDTSQWPDRFFFREVIARSGQPALDVGCGTGRLLLDFLGEGVDIDGVDNSREMLALCRAKAMPRQLHPNLFEQAMEALDLPRRYRTIVVPSSSFQLVIDPAAAAEAMRRFFAHLFPGGVLAMPFMSVVPTPEEEDWRLSREAERPEDGALVRRWSRSHYDPAHQLEHTQDRYQVLRDGEVVQEESHERSPATRGYSQAQARQLYAAAGFNQLQVLDGFGWTPASAQEEGELFCVLGTRP
jgi:ubiquinone/menaquinone biosynthesis C-methylase UbiE